MRRTKALVVVAALAASACPAARAPVAPPQPCRGELRGAFDIGSGSTKIQVARVRICADEAHELGHEVHLEKICFRKNEPLPYSTELKKSSDNRLPGSIVDRGIATMERMRQDALAATPAACGAGPVRKWRGIMTEVFRRAANADEVRARMAQALSTDGRPLPIRILSQDEEAYFGVYPLLHLGTLDPARLAVWDMGGGSTQITVFEGSGSSATPKVLKTALGTGTLGALLQKRKQETAPGAELNPIGVSLLQTAADEIRRQVEPAFAQLHSAGGARELLRGRVVVGVGGVLSISVPQLVGFETGRALAPLSIEQAAERTRSGGTDALARVSVAREAVETTMRAFVARDDAQLLDVARKLDIAAGFAPTLATGLVLVWGYSSPELLDVPAYTPLHLDGTDTLAVTHRFDDPTFWGPLGDPLH